MTNDPYRSPDGKYGHLRIDYTALRVALAEGKCVEIEPDVVVAWGESGFIRWRTWRTYPDLYPGMGEWSEDCPYIEFTENSKIVPYPTERSIGPAGSKIKEFLDSCSRIVPDPSLPEEPSRLNLLTTPLDYCKHHLRHDIECSECGRSGKPVSPKQEPQPLTYDEALAAEKVLIDLPDGRRKLYEGKYVDNWPLFHLAEQRGYRMQIVE